VRATAGDYRHGPDITGDDGVGTDVKFHAEPDVDSSLLEERPTKRAPEQPRARRTRKIVAAVDEHLSVTGRDHQEAIPRVSRPNGDRIKRSETIDLQAVAPVVPDPAVQ
jgi:hypothetical protein